MRRSATRACLTWPDKSRPGSAPLGDVTPRASPGDPRRGSLAAKGAACRAALHRLHATPAAAGRCSTHDRKAIGAPLLDPLRRSLRRAPEGQATRAADPEDSGRQSLPFMGLSGHGATRLGLRPFLPRRAEIGSHSRHSPRSARTLAQRLAASARADAAERSQLAQRLPAPGPTGPLPRAAARSAVNNRTMPARWPWRGSGRAPAPIRACRRSPAPGGPRMGQEGPTRAQEGPHPSRPCRATRSAQGGARPVGHPASAGLGAVS